MADVVVDDPIPPTEPRPEAHNSRANSHPDHIQTIRQSKALMALFFFALAASMLWAMISPLSMNANYGLAGKPSDDPMVPYAVLLRGVCSPTIGACVRLTDLANHQG